MKHRMWRASGVGVVILLVATTLAFWLVPPLLDWNRYRSDLEALVSANLGRNVTIKGPITLSLLPEPTLTASQISVADEARNGGGMTMSVAELRVRLALAPLLSGQVDAQELVLRGLDMRLPWPLSPDAMSLNAPTWLSSISARIEDGQVSIGNVAATHINATLGLAPDTGSYTLGGSTQISGQAWHLSARLTRSGGDGAAGLDLSLDGQGPMQGLGAMFSGQINADGALAGQLSGRGPDLSRLLAAPAVPFRAEGRLSVTGGLALADNLAMEIAGSPARGAVSLRLAPALRLDVSLAASRLDLDAWLPALLRSASGRIVASIPTGIDLSAEAATMAGGVLRGLRGSFDLHPDSVTLRDVTAVLPGDAQLQLAGEVHRVTKPGPVVPAVVPPASASATTPAPEISLALDGQVAVSAPNLRTTLVWMEAAGMGPLSSLPDRVMRTADVHAGFKVELGTRPSIVLTNISGMVDASHVQGTLTVRPAARLAISGTLAMDQLAIDPWLPTTPLSLVGLPQRMGLFDLDLQLRADRAKLRNEILAPASLDMLLENGRLAVRKLEIQSGGTHLAASGIINDLGRITDGRIDLSAATDTVAPLLSTWVPVVFPLASRLPRGALTLALQAAGPPEALALRATVDLGDLHLEAQPTLNLPGKSWAASLTLRHPGAPRLLDSIGLGGTASWLGDGSLSWSGTLSGSGPLWAPTRIASNGFDLTAGSLRTTGSMVLDRTGTPTLTGRLSADTLPLPFFYLRSPDPLPAALLAGWTAAVKVDAQQVLTGQSQALQQFSANLALNSGVLRLEGVKAKLEGGLLTGNIVLDSAASLPTLNGTLALADASPTVPVFDLPIDITAGSLDASATLSASGHSPAALLATLAGTVALRDKGGSLIGVDLSRMGPGLDDVDIRSALVGGATPIGQLDLQATLTDGAARIIRSSIASQFGSGSLSGLVDIAGMTSELRLTIRPAVEDPPEIALRLSGPFAGTRRTAEISQTLQWRAEHPLTPKPAAAIAPIATPP